MPSALFQQIRDATWISTKGVLHLNDRIADARYERGIRTRMIAHEVRVLTADRGDGALGDPHAESGGRPED